MYSLRYIFFLSFACWSHCHFIRNLSKQRRWNVWNCKKTDLWLDQLCFALIITEMVDCALKTNYLPTYLPSSVHIPQSNWTRCNGGDTEKGGSWKRARRGIQETAKRGNKEFLHDLVVNKIAKWDWKRASRCEANDSLIGGADWRPLMSSDL